MQTAQGNSVTFATGAATDSGEQHRPKTPVLCILQAGLGGGTGSGAAPMVCELAQSMDILTVSFATLPFTFEGRHRRAQALEAGKRMAKSVDSMVVVPNDKLLGSSIDRTVVDAFKYADSALVQGVRGISDIIMVR